MKLKLDNVKCTFKGSRARLKFRLTSPQITARFCLVTTNPNAQTNAIHGNIDAYDSSLCHCLLVNKWKKQTFFNESGGPEGGAIASSTIYLPLYFYSRDHF